MYFMEVFFLSIGSKNHDHEWPSINFPVFSLTFETCKVFIIFFWNLEKKSKIKLQHLLCQTILKSTQLTQISNLDAFIILGF